MVGGFSPDGSNGRLLVSHDHAADIRLDCGSRDQCHIHYGTRLLSARLSAAGIRHTYEEFDDNHSDIDYRMDVSLPVLFSALC